MPRETRIETSETEKKQVAVSCRTPEDWDAKLQEMAELAGGTKASVMKSAIAQYIGESMPSVLNDIAELKFALADVLEKNYLVERQNQNLHKRLQMLERKFKSLAS